jgi:hypothetical protein
MDSERLKLTKLIIERRIFFQTKYGKKFTLLNSEFDPKQNN